MRRVVAEREQHLPPVRALADRRAEPVRRVLPPVLVRRREQVGERRRRRAGGHPGGDGAARLGDQGGRRRRVEHHRQPGHPGVARLHGDPGDSRVVRQLDAADHQVHAAGGPGAYHPVELAALVPGQLVAAEQHRHPPRLRAASGRGGQFAQRAVLTGEHRGVDPADLLHQVVQQPAQPARPDEREQPGRAERREPGQAAAQVFRVVPVEPHRARVGPPDRAQQQRGHHGGQPVPVAAGQVRVPGVQQRDQRRHRFGAVEAYRADAQRAGRLGPAGGRGLPAVPGRGRRAGRLPLCGGGGPAGQLGEAGGVPGVDLGQAPVARGAHPGGHGRGGPAGTRQPIPPGGQLGLGGGEPGTGGAQGLGEHPPDPRHELSADVSHGTAPDRRCPWAGPGRAGRAVRRRARPR